MSIRLIASGTNRIKAKHSTARSCRVYSASFSPASLANLALWLDASKIGLADGTAVATWSDLSGSGNNATATGTQQPTFKTGILNGNGILRFNGTANYMTILDNAALQLTGDFTIYAVVSTTDVSGYILDKEGPSPNYYGWGMGLGQVNLPTNNGLLQGYTNTGGWRTLSSPTGNSGTARIFKMTRSGTTLNLAIDSTVSGNFTNSTTAVTNNMTIGTYNVSPASNGTYTLAADYGEILIYTAALNTTQDTNVKNYLKSKWATP